VICNYRWHTLPTPSFFPSRLWVSALMTKRCNNSRTREDRCTRPQEDDLGDKTYHRSSCRHVLPAQRMYSGSYFQLRRRGLLSGRHLARTVVVHDGRSHAWRGTAADMATVHVVQPAARELALAATHPVDASVLSQRRIAKLAHLVLAGWPSDKRRVSRRYAVLEIACIEEAWQDHYSSGRMVRCWMRIVR